MPTAHSSTLSHLIPNSKVFLILATLTDDEVCDLQEVKYVDKIPVGSGVPQKSPLKELIKIGIRKVRETGILAYIWKTWMSQMPKCAVSDVDVAPVDWIHFSSALYVLAIGMQISVALFILEILVAYYSLD